MLPSFLIPIFSVLSFLLTPSEPAGQFHFDPTRSTDISIQDSVVLAFCYTCHNPKAANHDDMLAPPLAGIKTQYMRIAGTREVFISRMSSFVKDPSEEKAIMKGPVNRFGLMPRPDLSEEEIMKIVEYIYENDIPQPDWYADHHRKMHGDH